MKFSELLPTGSIAPPSVHTLIRSLLLTASHHLFRMSVHLTLLLVVQQLLAKAPEIRKYAFRRLFPNRDLVREAEERSKKEDEPMPMEYV